ncbi:MAG: macro domain-containing protein [Actinobacteria bacterium]|nr:macro domain-containing protein [Actinomycetota bacterium]
MTIELAQADITKQQVDAIVNAANSHLEHVGGLARAIALAAGPKLAEESFEAPFVPVGEAYVTSAGNLPSRHVIHAVGPIWRGGTDGEPVLLSSAYRSAIAKAAELDCNSVALPAISTGIFGYPVVLAAPLALRAIRDGMRDYGVVRVARICLFSDSDYAVFRDAADAVGIAVIEIAA